MHGVSLQGDSLGGLVGEALSARSLSGGGQCPSCGA